MKSLNEINKPLKVILGLATIWPLIYMPLFFIFIFSTFFNSAPVSNEFPSQLLIIFPLHFFTIILGFVLLGLFIFDLFKNEKIERDKKTLWAIVLFMGGFVAMPIYWYLYVWKASKTKKNQ